MRLFGLIGLFCVASISFGQLKNPTFFSFSPKGGFMIAHRPFMSHLVRENSYGFELIAWQQDTSHSIITQRLKKPLRGLGIEYRNFGYDEVLGKGISLTEIMVFPMFQTKGNLCLDLAMGAGIGFITKYYNKENNPTNNAIGSHFNARVNIKLSLLKYYTKYHFGGGIEMTHFSNGSVKNPNLGLNSPSLFLQFGYNVNERNLADKKKYEKSFHLDNQHNLSATFIASAKEIGAIPFQPKLYPVVAGRLAYTYSKRGLWGVELAADFVHNEANFHIYHDTTFVRSDIFQIGFYLGTYVQFYKSQIAFGLGVYARDKIDPVGRIYNRIGYRYYFKENWFGLFTIKANYGKADYIEFGVGYKFLKW